MFCQSCGKENPSAAEFCQHCGREIQQPTGAPTSAPATQPPHPAQTGAIGEYSGFWLRFVAFLIDEIIWNLLVTLVVVLLVMYAFAAVMAGGNIVAVILIVILAGFGITLGWYFYHAYCESSDWQGSIGKRALGLYVTDAQGGRLTFGRALARNFSIMISHMTMGVGYIMAGFTKKKQALHDMVADCVVCRRP